MSQLINILSGALKPGVISQIGEQLGMDEEQTAGAISAAMPVLIDALARNSSDGDGAEALHSALGKHDGSILDNVADYVGGGDFKDGGKILGHLLGGKLGVVQKGVGMAAGLDKGNAGQLIAVLAPILMGALGKEKSSGGLDVGGLSDFLGKEKESAFKLDPDSIGSLGKLLDLDNDDDISDDLLNIGGKLLGTFLSR